MTIAYSSPHPEWSAERSCRLLRVAAQKALWAALEANSLPEALRWLAHCQRLEQTLYQQRKEILALAQIYFQHEPS